MKIFLGLIAILGWFALIMQFYLHINSGIAPLPELLIRYFSYFTIDSNLLVAICCTALLFLPVNSKHFFTRATTQAAFTVYILIVGITYNLILRSLWKPTGMQRVVDELLHLIIPILFFIYWFLFAPKHQLKWNNFWPWLIFPLIYSVFILVRGSFSGFYPYPFMDVDKLGLGRVLLNSVAVTAAFFAVSLVLIALGKWQTKGRTTG